MLGSFVNIRQIERIFFEQNKREGKNLLFVNEWNECGNIII